MALGRKKAEKALTLVALLALAALPAASPVRAFSQGDLVEGGAVWLEVTIAIALVFIMSMAFSLQIARGYFIRILNKFTLRLGADIWWLAYVLIRDGLIFLSFITALLVFLPGTFLDYDIAVPFMPLSVLLFGAALVTKLYFDADDNRNAFRLVTTLVFLGTLLWIFSVVFVTESPVAMATEMGAGESMSSFPQSMVSATSFWYVTYYAFSSIHNIDLAIATFNVAFVALAVLGIVGFAHPVLHSRLPKLKKAVAPTPVTPAASPAPALSRMTGLDAEAPGEKTQRTQVRDSMQLRTREKIDYIA